MGFAACLQPDFQQRWNARYLRQLKIVIRGPGGVGRQLGAEHSQRLEAYWAVPGLKIVACSTSYNAKAKSEMR